MRAIGLLLLLAAVPVAEQRYFQYERPVVGDAQGTGQSCVALDSAIFAHSRELADLRLYRGNEEVPYAVRTMEMERPDAASVTLLNAGTRDGRVVFDAAMPEGRYKDLHLAVDKSDFLATVTVTGGDAESGAGTKLGEYTIFDLSSQGLGRSTVLHLPESDFQYLHFSVAGPVEAKNFTGVAVNRVPQTQARYVTVGASSAPVQKGQDTVFTFSVVRGVPVERLVIEPGTKPAEFSRSVTITSAVSGTKTDVEIAPVRADGQLLRVHRKVDGRAVDEERLSLPLSLGNVDAVRAVTVAIHNGSDAPLEIRSARLEMVERDLCFDAAVGADYALFYGDAALETPSYDYARLFETVAHPAMARLGAEEKNAQYVARPDARPFTERHRWLLWLVLIAVIALLALVALRTAKTALPREP